MAEWLMPNDFELRIGHTFSFGTPLIPAMGFGGMRYSEVLDFEPERMLKISWCTDQGGEKSLDTTVTFTLLPEYGGTRLLISHDGFDPANFYQKLTRRLLASAWSGAGHRISMVIDKCAG